MRTRSRLLLRLGFVGIAWLVFASAPKAARAEADTFGVGDGHSGAKTAASADEVVNTYAPLAAAATAGSSTLQIGATTGAAAPFAANDLVLVWRGTGVAIGDAVGQTPVNIDAVASGNVGRYELARVQSVNGSSLVLTKPLVNGWEALITQVIRVPEYTTVTIPAGTGLAAKAWSGDATVGFTGGIIVFFANDTVTNNGASPHGIHADARGFRGGPDRDRNSVLAVDCQGNDGTVETGFAPKGEGVVHTGFGGDNNGGRANRANGAGGGNCIESGGGGGGNAGLGGKGGNSVSTGVTGGDLGGLGGSKLTYTLAAPTTSNIRITMGGGGGSGEQKDDRGSGGGIGGGVVLVRAKAIAGTGLITANGQNAENVTTLGVLGDGAGGGGAGGTILLRVVGNLDCNGIEAKGGAGGSTQLAGLNFFGPGGGGAGGRILAQTTTRGASCTIDAAGGANGTAANQGARGATAGGAGEAADNTAPKTDPNYCFSNAFPGPPALQCANPSPVCNVGTGYCAKCNGGNGELTDLPCPSPNQPVCITAGGTAGNCEGCNGDFGSGTSTACQLSGNPYCFTGAQPNPGSCGKCKVNGDCAVGTHPGPNCEPVSGACGVACTKDSDCKGTEWCGQNVCIPKTPNKQPVTTTPPFTGECTVAAGQRTCIAGVCEESDDRCGLKNGTPCATNPQCRSEICFDKDKLCGKPTGEPCQGNGQCRSDKCDNGVCTGCQEDNDCPSGKICDARVPGGQCVDGCRPGAVIAPDASAEQTRGVCPPGLVCVVLDGGAIGVCQPGNDAGADAGDGGPFDAGDTAGIIEGGGCSCNTTPSAASPLAIGAAAFGLLAFARRRRDRNNKRSAS